MKAFKEMFGYLPVIAASVVLVLVAVPVMITTIFSAITLAPWLCEKLGVMP